MSHYLIAALFSAVLYFKWGPYLAWFFFLSYLAYKMYKAVKFLGKGKSITVFGPDGEISSWTFKGSLFSFSADLDSMTARFTSPAASTYIHDRCHVGKNLTEGKVDVSIPLRAVSVHSHDETAAKDTSYSATDFGYRVDGSFGQVYVPKVLTTVEKTGRIELSIFVRKGSPKGRVEEGRANVTWTRDGYDTDRSYSPRGAPSQRQAENFLHGWKLVEKAIQKKAVPA